MKRYIFDMFSPKKYLMLVHSQLMTSYVINVSIFLVKIILRKYSLNSCENMSGNFQDFVFEFSRKKSKKKHLIFYHYFLSFQRLTAVFSNNMHFSR